MLSLVLIVACAESKVPDDAVFYNVEVTAVSNDCHPDNTEGYKDTFEYAVAFDASSATIYIGESAFAAGTITGCDLTYQTVVFGEDRGGGEIKYQLFGQAAVESTDSNGCVEDPDAEWQGTEYYEIVNSADESVQKGCTYNMTTLGTLKK